LSTFFQFEKRDADFSLNGTEASLDRSVQLIIDQDNSNQANIYDTDDLLFSCRILIPKRSSSLEEKIQAVGSIALKNYIHTIQQRQLLLLQMNDSNLHKSIVSQVNNETGLGVS